MKPSKSRSRVVTGRHQGAGGLERWWIHGTLAGLCVLPVAACSSTATQFPSYEELAVTLTKGGVDCANPGYADQQGERTVFYCGEIRTSGGASTTRYAGELWPAGRDYASVAAEGAASSCNPEDSSLGVLGSNWLIYAPTVDGLTRDEAEAIAEAGGGRVLTVGDLCDEIQQ